MGRSFYFQRHRLGDGPEGEVGVREGTATGNLASTDGATAIAVVPAVAVAVAVAEAEAAATVAILVLVAL